MKWNVAFIVGIFCLTAVAGCGHKKIVAKNCDQAATSGVWICDEL